MNLSGPDWVKLNKLLDEALDLTPDERTSWMESLPAEYAPLRETLRDLLLREAGPETADVLKRMPLLPTSPKAAFAADDVIGPYRLIRQIGSGGMATVWLAERADGSLQRRVALKLPRVSVIARELAERLDRERDILASLEHPGIARLYDAGIDEGGQPFLALEYVDGVALDAYVNQRQLALSERLDLFVQVARAVAFAHARLIVHRDLKPGNVLVNGAGEVRLLDFGIARLLEPNASQGTLSSAAVRAFTPRYAAPEQFAGELPTVATDIYSLGVLLYELIAGCSPYPAARTRSDTVVCLDPKPISESVDTALVPEVRGDVEAILRKALQADPTRRYESVVEFIEDVQRHQRGLPVRAHADSTRYRIGKFLRRHRLAAALSGALFAAMIAGAGVSLWQAQVAVRERDRALRLYTEVETRNEFWTMIMTEGFVHDEAVSVAELLSRAEAMADTAFATSPYQHAIATDAIAGLYAAHGMESTAFKLTRRAMLRMEGVDEGNRAAAFRCSYAVAIDAHGQTQEADRLLAATIEQVADEPDLKQFCLQSRFYVAHHNNDAAAALRYIEEAYQLSEQLPAQSPSKAASMLGELARGYALNGKTELANRYYAEAMQRFEALGRAESQLAYTVLSGWATVGTNSGNPAWALERFETAIAIQQKHAIDSRAALSSIGNRANALASLGRLDAALSDYQQMLDGFDPGWGTGVMVYALGGMADVYLTRGDLPSAQAAIDRLTPEVRSNVSSTSSAGLRLMVIDGRILTRQGKFAEAEQKLNQAVEAFDSGAIVVGGRARAYIARAELLREQSRLEEALADSQRAIDVATAARGDAKYSNFLGLAALTRADILLQMNDRSKAREALRLAAENLRGTVDASHPEAQRAERLLRSLPMA